MDLFLGIDGGGTHTRALVVEASGRVRGRGQSGTGNLHHAPRETVAGHLGDAIQQALATVPAKPGEIVAAFLGMAGVTSAGTANAFRGLAVEAGLERARIAVDHDIRIALAGGLAGRPGIALIVGTGSSCYGRTSDGQHWQTGGWGSLVADEGSGYDLSRRAMIEAVRMADGRTEPSAIQDAVFRWLGVQEVSGILARLYEQGIERDEIASFAPRVVELAADGDPVARAILRAGAAELGEMVAANHARLPTAPRPEVVVTGGLGTAPTLYREMIREAIFRVQPDARWCDAELDPVTGAALLALDLGGVGTSPEVVSRLREGLS